jgi:hypothetical protein
MAYDTEDVLLEIKRHIADASVGINSFITSINNDKSVSDVANYGQLITLDPLDLTRAFYLLNENVHMLDFMQFMGITIESEKLGDMGEVELTVGIKIHIRDRQDGFIDARALRYRQAIKNTFAYNRLYGGLTFTKMAGMETEAYMDQQGREVYRAVGFMLRTIYAIR